MKQEDEFGAADLYIVAVLECPFACRHAIDEGPVQAFQVRKLDLAVIAATNETMSSRDQGVADCHRVTRLAADNGFRFCQQNGGALQGTGNRDEPWLHEGGY